MRFLLFRTIFYILALGIAAGSWACASRAPQPTLKNMIDHKRIMAMQKAEMAEQEVAMQKISAMSAEGHERLGDGYLRQGKIELAFKQYYEALALNPSQTRPRYKIGRLFLEKGLVEDAQKEFQEILKLDPNYAPAYEGLGRTYFHKREFCEAEKYFREAIRLDPNSWQGHNLLGITYDRQGNYDAAMAEYKAAMALKPNIGALFNNLGMSLFLKREYEKAAVAFGEALKMEADNRIYNNLAVTLSKLGRYQDALEAFKKAGDEASAHYNLGCVYMLEGKNLEAIELFQKAINLKPVFYINAYENMKKAKAAIQNTEQK